jgi:molybdenum cofactor cytidylyltransferase
VEKMSSVSAILLGAGESKRMGVNKLGLPWGKKTVLEHCLDILLRSNIKETVVVLSERTEAFRSRLDRRGVSFAMNPFFRKGMSTSIVKGIRSIDPQSEGMLIALGDQPFLKSRTINALIRAFAEGERGIVVPSFQGKTGHPVIFHRRYERELMKLRGDVGGRSIMDRHPEDVFVVKVKSEAVLRDIDTRDDYLKGMKLRPLKRKDGCDKEWGAAQK